MYLWSVQLLQPVVCASGQVSYYSWQYVPLAMSVIYSWHYVPLIRSVIYNRQYGPLVIFAKIFVKNLDPIL